MADDPNGGPEHAPQAERLSRLEERVRGLGRSVDELRNSLPSQFQRVETKVEEAARRDRVEWSQLIDRQRDQLLAVLKEERDRVKDDQRERQTLYDKTEQQNLASRQKVDKLWMAVVLLGILFTFLSQGTALIKLFFPGGTPPASP